MQAKCQFTLYASRICEFLKWNIGLLPRASQKQHSALAGVTRMCYGR
ncbi:TMV resistance protein N-like [Acetobacter orientalis]|uniref:TMV resistance protein N-like n=1 Tax=Acetobacter orientalis TaxID=146474 RepID=A0A2Z5ZLS0_9PROT|nr:TMV resistance protein N-like [Acetobacter orientalis]